MQESSNYYSIIPMEVLLDKNLSDKAKLIYAELSSLDSKAGYAWCSNKYLAELFGVSIPTVSRAIKELNDYKYIKCEYETDNARKIYLKKVLSKTIRPIIKNDKTSNHTRLDPIITDDKQESIDEKVNKESIIESRGKSKNKIFKPPTIEDVKRYCEERKNNVNPQRFIDFYESKGWMIGKNKMKDWKACVRTWEQLDSKKNIKPNIKKSNRFEIDRSAYEKLLKANLIRQQMSKNKEIKDSS